MAKRSKRKRREAQEESSQALGQPASRFAPGEILKPLAATDYFREKAGRGQAMIGSIMLAGCPCFESTYDETTAQPKVVPMVRPLPVVCPGCGEDAATVQNTGRCGRLIDSDDAMALILPPELLHAPPEEAGLLLPD